MRRRLTHRQLEAFAAVLETGSITRAAQRLHVSQPALSQLIANFESDLGYPMFRRANGRLAPTAEAEMVREEVRNALVAVERACRRAQDIGTFQAGSLALAAFPSLAASALPRLLAGFCEAHPRVRVSLDAMNSRQMLEAVGLQRVDFAISDLPETANGVTTEHLGRYHAVCAVQPDHRFAKRKLVPLTEVGKEPFVCVGEEGETRTLVQKGFQAAGIDLQWSKEVNLCASACAWVAAAGGVSIVDPFASEDWVGRLALVSTEPPLLFDLWLLRSQIRPLSRIASEFLQQLRGYVKTLPGAVSERPRRSSQIGSARQRGAAKARRRI